MSEQTPSIGRIVHYRLTPSDADAINRRRTSGGSIAERIAAKLWPLGAQAHIGNRVHAGDEFPLLVTKVWGNAPDSAVNGQVLLDGSDVLWATSVHVAVAGADHGTYSWPVRV